MKNFLLLPILIMTMACTAQDCIFSYSQYFYDRAGFVFDTIPGYTIRPPEECIKDGVDFIFYTNHMYNMMVDEELEFYIVDPHIAMLGDMYLLYDDLDDLRELVVAQVNVYWNNRRPKNIKYTIDRTSP